ncbi:HEAT repeat domain-containing protein [bacterium]|nr:HEAT repeat domain-containing protein [bacterium]
MKTTYQSVMLCGMLLWSSLSAKSTVQVAPDQLNSLSQRIEWALEQAGTAHAASGAWLGYSIIRPSKKNTHISWNSGDGSGYETLAEILNRSLNDSRSESGTLLEAAQNALGRHTGQDGSMVDREQAFLIHLPEGLMPLPEGLMPLPERQQKLESAEEIRITDMDRPVRLRDLPVLWLGTVSQTESLDFLSSQYRQSRSERYRKDLIVCVATHTLKDRVIPFLNERVQSGEPEELREDAVFWLGQQEDLRALRILGECIRADPSSDVQEKAVFGISQMHLPEAEDALIDLAYHARSRELRKKAVFWLGQKASENAARALKDVVFNAEETEIQKHAVFALSQQHGSATVDDLVRIAETHPNPEIRKTAIFWLGETGDPRAVDALVRMARE